MKRVGSRTKQARGAGNLPSLKTEREREHNGSIRINKKRFYIFNFLLRLSWEIEKRKEKEGEKQRFPLTPSLCAGKEDRNEAFFLGFLLIFASRKVIVRFSVFPIVLLSSLGEDMASSSASATVAVDKATSDLLLGPDWTTNMEICDSVNSLHW